MVTHCASLRWVRRTDFCTIRIKTLVEPKTCYEACSVGLSSQVPERVNWGSFLERFIPVAESSRPQTLYCSDRSPVGTFECAAEASWTESLNRLSIMEQPTSGFAQDREPMRRRPRNKRHRQTQPITRTAFEQLIQPSLKIL